MRRVVPFLAIALIAVGFYMALKDVPTGPAGSRGGAGARGPALTPSSRPATESQPETRPPPIIATPYVETAPTVETRPETVPATRPAHGVVELEVAREDGRPIAEAFVDVAFGDVKTVARTNASGIAELAANPGVTAAISVWGKTFCPFERQLPLDPGKLRFVVPNGARVAGRLSIEGRAPEEPILIKIDGAASGCPNLKTLTGDEHGFEHHTHADEAGNFEFFNLPPTWHGDLVVPDPYLVLQPDGSVRSDPTERSLNRTVRLEVPNATLNIALFEHVAIKGRIVRNGTREYVHGWVIAKLFTGSESESAQSHADEDGRFRIWVNRDRTRATLEVSDAHQLGTRTIDVPGPFDSVRNLGDIDLAPIRGVAIRVRDASGQPIEGAIATIQDTWSWSRPTNEHGETEVSVDRIPRDVRVGKLGYTTVTRPLAADNSGPIEIELSPGNQLIIDVALADGSIPDAGLLVAQLSSKSTMFAGPDGMSDDIFTKTGASESFEEGSGEDESYINIAFGSSRRLIMGGFKPGVQMTLRLRGTTIDELVDERFLSIGATETKTVTIRTPSMPQEFAGRIRTADGDPIDDAGVVITVKETEQPMGTMSGAEGRFLMRGIFAFAVDVKVTKEGFVPLTQRNVPVPPPGAERDFILIPSRDVTVMLVDENGQPVLEADSIDVAVPGDPADLHYPSKDLGNGSHLVRELPPGPVEIHVVVGTTQVISDHDSRVPVARIVIPTEGGAEIRWRSDDADPAHSRIRVESLASGLAFQSDLEAATTDHRFDLKLPPDDYWAIAEGFDEENGQWIVLGYSAAFRIRAHESVEVDVVR